MKINRNYRFVLTVLDNDMINAGKIRIDKNKISGKRMFSSECHYYAEKSIIESIKDADKRDVLSEFYGHTYCIYKENKPMTKVVEREKDGKKIVETVETPGKAMLLETITVDENGVTIR